MAKHYSIINLGIQNLEESSFGSEFHAFDVEEDGKVTSPTP